MREAREILNREILNKEACGAGRVIACYCGLLMFLMTFLLPSCVEDLIYDKGDNSSQTGFDIPGHMAVSLVKGSGTRANPEDISYEDGEEEDNEYALAPAYGGTDHHFLIMYGTDKSKPAAVLVLNEYTQKQNSDNNITLTVSRIYGADSFEFTKDKDEDTKSAFQRFLDGKICYVILNTDLTQDDLKDISESSLLGQEMDSYKITVNGEDYFTMANSVYLNNQNQIQIASAVNKEKVFEDEWDAINNPAVVAYVERVAAKVTVNFNMDSYSGGVLTGPEVQVYRGLTTDENSYTIQSRTAHTKIRILGYGVNALEPNTKLFKNIQNGAMTPGANTYFTGWNNGNVFRSFWAVDDHYVIDATTRKYYPQQYRKALETDSVYSYHTGGYLDSETGGRPAGSLVVNQTNDSYYLSYLNFDEIKGKTGNIYSLENTYDNSLGKNSDNKTARLWKRGYFSAGTHLIVACQIEIGEIESDDANLSSKYTPGCDLYFGQNDIFYSGPEEILQAKLDLLNQVILPGGTSGIRVLNAAWSSHTPHQTGDAEFVENVTWNMGSVLWIRDANGKEWKATVDDLTLIPAEVSGGDSKLLITPKLEYAQNGVTFILGVEEIDGDGKGTGRRDTSRSNIITYDQLVSLFHKLIGAIEHFKEGYMYYAVPILHNVTELQENTSNNTDSWYTVGDIGVVRNNWYEINVKSISGIGTAVDDPSQPIIPELEAQREYINATIEILPWHKITENVPFVPWN